MTTLSGASLDQIFEEIRRRSGEETTIKKSTKKSKKSSNDSDDDSTKKKRAPSAFATHMKEVIIPLYKEAMGDKKGKAGLHLKIGGYLKTNNIPEPTLADVRKAIEFLEANPEYKSKSAEKKASSASVKSSEETDVKIEKKVSLKEKMNAAKAKTVKTEKTPELKFEMWEHDDETYVRSGSYVLDMDTKWVGTWDGTTIDTTASMPDHVALWVKEQE